MRTSGNVQLTVRLSADTREQFQRVAKAAHLEDTKFGAMVLARFSDLKPEHALDALAAIPKEYFKARPGRPSASPESDKSAAA